MDTAQILNQLTHAEGLPKAALEAASEQRAEIVPVFLREIDLFVVVRAVKKFQHIKEYAAPICPDGGADNSIIRLFRATVRSLMFL